MVVLLNARHEYGALEEVKTELSWLVAELKCPNFIGKSVPFLTDSSELGERNIIHSGKSEIYGDFSVEESESRDVDNEEFTYRRLIFQNQPTLVQCQCRISKKEENLKKGKKKQVVSEKFLTKPTILIIISICEECPDAEFIFRKLGRFLMKITSLRVIGLHR